MALSAKTTKFLAMKTADDVASFFGATYGDLGKRLYRWNDLFKYESFEIPKKSGGVRKISAPRKWLKDYQREIASVLLECYQGHPAAHGFASDRSIISNATPHLNKRFIFNSDLEDFFPTINYGRVRGLFASKFFNFPEPVASVLAQLCCYKDALPQGAPSSPIITNYIALHMDRQLYRLAKSNRCTYTRYADDITFSFTTPRNKLPENIIVEDATGVRAGASLANIVNSCGFSLNTDKTRLRGRSQRQEVTGLTVNGDLNVPRKLVRQTRSMLYAWRKFGLGAAAAEYHAKYCTKHRASPVPPDFVQVVRGKLNFIKSVRGTRDEIVVRLAKEFNELADMTGSAKVAFVEPETALTKFGPSVIVVEYAYDDDGEVQCAQGTGFYLNGVGWVTCEHVVCDDDGKPHKEIEAFAANDHGHRYSVTVEHADKHRDIAILSLTDKDGTPAKAKVTLDEAPDIHQGQCVTVVGFPAYTVSQPPFIAESNVGTKYTRHGVSVFELTTHQTGGISGGPVVDEHGKLVGMVTKGVVGGMGSNLAVAHNEIIAAAADVEKDDE